MGELELVAYHCPQCGGNVTATASAENVRCEHCGCVLRVEGKKQEAPPPPPPRPKQPERPPPFVPPREPTVVTRELGRFEVTLLRQSIRPDPTEAMIWVPLDEERAGIYLLRIVSEQGSVVKPLQGPLGELALAATKSLRERRDPGLALKAALRALDASRAPGFLGGFVAVLDSERSHVVALNAGAPGALLHASVELGSTTCPGYDHRALDRKQLRASQDAFGNEDPVLLARGDVLVVSSLGAPRSLHDALDKHWTASSLEVARAVHDAYWAERFKAWDSHVPPNGDVLVVAVRVRGNSELRPEPQASLPVKTFETKLFQVALAAGEGAFVDFRPLHSERHQLVWIEGAPPELCAKAAESIFALFDGKSGDNDNARRAGREAGIPGGARALVLQMHDVHGKVSYWTQGWKSAFPLGTRTDRTPTHQQFDGGGEAWPRAGGRLLFPGSIPLARNFWLLDQLPLNWTGGKASCFYELAKDHEDHATGEGFLAALACAVRRDAASAPLDGIGAVTRREGT